MTHHLFGRGGYCHHTHQNLCHVDKPQPVYRTTLFTNANSRLNFGENRTTRYSGLSFLATENSRHLASLMRDMMIIFSSFVMATTAVSLYGIRMIDLLSPLK